MIQQDHFEIVIALTPLFDRSYEQIPSMLFQVRRQSNRNKRTHRVGMEKPIDINHPIKDFRNLNRDLISINLVLF
jgi:hypothetical protein